MNNYWIIICVALVFILIAYSIGYECGFDHAVNDMIKHLEEEKTRDNNEKEGKTK